MKLTAMGMIPAPSPPSPLPTAWPAPGSP